MAAFDTARSRSTGLIFTLIACGAVAACTPHGQEQRQASAPGPAAPLPVQVMTVALEAGGENWSYTGVVRPRYESDLGFRVAGKIVSRNVDVGQAVRAGQMLARLDDTDLKLSLEAQQAELAAALSSREQAVAAEARYVTLLAKGHVSQAAVDQRRAAADEARSRVARAERNVELARNQLSYAVLTATADGVVSGLSAEAGQVVSAGQGVVRVAQLGELEVAVAVPEHLASAVKAAKAEIAIWNQSGSVPARLRELSPEADSVTRTYQARFSLPASTKAELGRTATVRLARDGGGTVARVPLAAVTNDGHAAHVFVVEPGAAGKPVRVRRQPVTVRALDETSATLASGLGDGDRVVTLGVHRLDEGRPVIVVEQRAALW